ncbi:TPA: restriction endonuclease subunit S [Escherichia coli]|uniref:Restriction endonuclease subunit S n=1 Tax=Escherichia coli O141:H4 TaxID=2861806 RepID=A0ABD7G0G8_ECOLX|nr:restriction endonuclease subunit S [Escherichia coli]EFH8583374.1 restriction endonuclease subunit S [Escherichia coli]EFI3707237.1 restriction endonuclease subunit S [Escherichia coli]EFI4436112.1 restriction endonuclease subunit S [Escherichia coli]EFI5462297.1 restriction endonuclease subunit S [Escherichia coli]QYE42507.1 restriction endonuclease subunit S [Escherichia coli O141:H4]
MSEMSYLEKLLDGVEVEWLPLGEVSALRRGRVMSKGYLTENFGPYPVYSSQTANNGKIGSINTFDFDGEYISWTTDGANAGTVFYRTGKFSITNVCGLITLKSKYPLIYKFLFYWLTIEAKKHVYSGMGNPKLMSHQVENIPVPIPCPDNPEKSLAIQSEIVRVLDKFTALTAELTAELNMRKKQYNYYRDQLLSFKEDEVEWKTLGEVAQYSKTRISFELLDERNYVGVDNLLQNRAGKSLSNHVPTSGKLTEFIPNDILIGNIRPYLKKIWQADCIGGTNGDVLVIRCIDSSINTRYLYQILADDKFFEYNMQHAKGAKMPRGSKEDIMKYPIPVPPLTWQARIVEILDKFDTLTNSITEGLPREIELRQKQYEYYRDLLFSFLKTETVSN